MPPTPLVVLVGRKELMAHNYGVFTARYGNVYTTRQLLQLYQRAYGLFQPADTIWRRRDGRFVDPFRPQIQPDGYHTEEELLVDRRQHLASVRQAFETLDVLVFTLGPTEAFASTIDGAGRGSSGGRVR